MTRLVFDNIGAPILLAIFGVLFVLEGRFRLRRRVQKRAAAAVVNAVVSIPAFGLLRFVFLPVLVWLAYKNEHWQFGLNYLYILPGYAELIISVCVLDYGNYVWHILLHKIPLLWRFHLVHHIDRDLDVTTALRFHFGEIIASIIYRGAVVIVSGAAPFTVLLYEILFEAATQFHHANLKLPLGVEKLLNKIFVTPRMHGIHHSVIKQETDSNFSVIFSFWDRLHKTAQLRQLDRNVTIGVPSYNDGQVPGVGFLWKLPFGKIRPWNKPS